MEREMAEKNLPVEAVMGLRLQRLELVGYITGAKAANILEQGYP